MRARFVALIGLLVVLSLTSSSAAAPAPFLAPPSARTLTVTLIGAGGAPLKDAEVHLLTPGQATMKITRTNARGQATVETSGGFSFWIRVWAAGYAVLERPYVPASDGSVLTLRATPYTTVLTGMVTDEQGLPVHEAQINLFRAGFGLESSAMTNELGLYTLKEIRADGAYTIQVEAKGFRPVSQATPDLSANARNQVDISLTRATGAVTGEVVDAKNNRPVSGVLAELLLNGWGVVGRTTTDSLGAFYFAAPPAQNGVYQIRLSRPDFETSTSGNFAITPGSWTDFSGGDRFALNRLYGQISGKVVDEANNVLDKVEVHLQRQGLGTVEVAVTDVAGKYRFNQVTGGTYRVRAFPRGDAVRSDSGWVTVAGGDDLTARIIAESPNRTSYGFESISGTVKNHLGDPVAGATVWIHRGSEETYTAQTDSEGRYDVSVKATVSSEFDPDDDDGTNDPATGYHVMVNAVGYLTNDQPQTDGAPPSLITVRDDADNQANFVMQPESATIAGRVVNDRGQFLAGVKVGLTQEGRTEVTESITDSQGRYQFSNLPFAKQGRYAATMIDSAYVEGGITPDGAPLGITTLSPANPTSMILVARPSKTVIQGLAQAGDDKPAEGAEVTVSRPSDSQHFPAQVRSDGSYQIQVPAAPGEQYLVRARGQATLVNADSNVVDPGTAFGSLVNLTVHPTATISGRVFGVSGQPAEGARVLLYAEGSAIAVKTTTTDALGLYTFKDLAPGRRYTVLAAEGSSSALSNLAPGETIITPLIQAVSGEVHWLDLQLGASMSLVNP